MTVATSATRVPEHTEEQYNRRIRRSTEANIAYYALHPEGIDERLEELDREWDIERVLEANASTLALTGTVFGLIGSRWWLLLPTAVTGFLLQHAVQGWCPPVPMLRRMDVRTAREIEAERYALKALRGDFREVPGGGEGGGAEAATHAATEATGRLS